MLYGTIVRWNDDRGFGFIKPDNENVEIFVHISSFGKLYKRPLNGDRVCFDIMIEQSGKQKAKFARIIENEGSDTTLVRATSVIRDTTKPQYRNSHRKKLHLKNVIIIALIILGIMQLSKVFNKPDLSGNSNTLQNDQNKAITQNKVKPIFKCEGKIHCSQMSSYEEAVFYLNNCPGTKMDGDNDGCPCEDQFGKR